MTARILVGLIVLVLLIPVLLYLPPVQDLAVKIATSQVEKSTGMKVNIGTLRLRWPLKLCVDDAEVIQATGDTMLTARRLDAGVKLWPLFKGKIEIDRVRLDTAFYQLGTSDSLMWLRANLRHFELEASALNMKMDTIDIDRAMADGVNVRLILKPDTTATPPDTTASKPMLITARDIELRDVVYSMQMEPTIDTLGCTIALARLGDGRVDTGRRTVDVRTLRVDSVDAVYLTPPAGGIVNSKNTYDSEGSYNSANADSLWTVTAGELQLTARRARYGVRGANPLPGLDMNCLEVTGVAISIVDFFNHGQEVKVPLRSLTARERCGLQLDAAGTFAMDSLTMRADGFEIATANSRLRLTAAASMGDFATDPHLPLALKAEGHIGIADIVLAMPALRGMLAPLPLPRRITVDADINGSLSLLDVKHFIVDYPGLLDLSVSGEVANVTDFKRLGGQLTIDGSLTGARRLMAMPQLRPLAKTMRLPDRMTIRGTIDYTPSAVDGDITVTADNGRLAARGSWQRRAEGYDAELEAISFPVGDFLPATGVGNLSASVKVNGRGYNPLAAGTSMNVRAQIGGITYNGTPYRDILLDAGLADGHAEGTLSSGNENADLDVDFTADIARDSLAWDLTGDIRRLDMRALKLMTDTCEGTVALATRGTMNRLTRHISATAELRNIDWLIGQRRLTAPDLTLTADINPAEMHASLTSGDLAATVNTACGPDSLMASLTRLSRNFATAMAHKRMDVDSLQAVLPPLQMSLYAGPDNPLSRYLSPGGDTPLFSTLNLRASTDSVLTIAGGLTGFAMGSTRLDSITVGMKRHGSFLIFNAQVNNRPGTMDEWAHVTLNGFISADRLSMLLRQRNIDNESGYRLGLTATSNDSLLTLKFVPYNPVIAYKPWTINEDNYISYNFATRDIAADLTLSSSKSSLRLLTTPDSTGNHSEDIAVILKDIYLQDWLSMSPFAPPVTGTVNSDLRLRWDRVNLTGSGTVSLDNFTYNRQRVGDFDIDLKMANDPRTGFIRADLGLMVDSVKTITVSGVLNDSTRTDPFALDFSMIRFPLSTVNAFLPPGTARLKGTLNGRMDIVGSASEPRFNGWIAFDSTSVRVDMLGSTLRFPSTRIPVDSNIVRFNKFAISGYNDNPLTIDGTVDIRRLSDVSLNLTLNAENMMLVNSQRARGANVYGKAYVDLDASVKGNMQFMLVNANAALLPGTNVTYVTVNATDNLPGASSPDDMVHFVQFSDTAQVAKSDTIAQSMAMVLSAFLDIRQGTTLNVDLSTDGKNRVSLQGQGSFDFSMSPASEGRLTGRYTIDKGYVRYTPPMMSEKLFDFTEGSYVAFNGELLNPLLNIHAVDKVRANVTQTGQNSRLIDFDVSLSVTNTLQNMNVAFDLSTDDDVTVQNELQSMSADQRANQAMNLLLYNVYTGPGTKGNANLGVNPLFNFLESKINSWAASNIKGVDISFGIEQYDRTYDGTTSTATSYSYQVSKTLFDDRFKIVVGGNYTTDAQADENFAENLISNISFEYMLNRSGSMYVRIFRHTGYESILEGEVTQTGVGFVLKHKVNSLRDLFRFGRRKKDKAAPADKKDNGK